VRLFFIARTSRGIGIAVAVALVKAGASFIGLGARGSLAKAEEVLDAAKEAGKAVPTIAAVELDVTNTTSVDAAVEKIENSFRRLDILINNTRWLELSIPIHSSIQIYGRRATKLTCEAFILP
jgi:NAD(P)-dependent dehydrogenase (short-subunit alcohol dehydrogenase family)